MKEPRLYDRINRRWRRRPILERLLAKIEIEPSHTWNGSCCWLWAAYRDRGGYGRIQEGGRKGPPLPAHRVSYEQLVGPIADGLTIDHLCRVPRCVNPDHLEPVTMRENLFRGTAPSVENAAKTRCIHGHPFDAENTVHRKYRPGGGRECRQCNRNRAREYQARRRRRAKLTAAVASILLLVASSCRSEAVAPSIVLLVADDLSVKDIPLAMPRVAQLAEQGVQFDAAFVPLALCTPSRISLLTGTLPRTHGFRSNDATGFDASDTIATRLRAAGYRTTISGKLLNRHWRATNLEAGWDTYLPFRGHDDHGTEQSNVLKAQALAAMAGPGPAFVYIGAVAPHGPLPGPDICQAQPLPERPPTVSESRWSQRMSALCGLDDLVASIVEARGPNTYVIFTADNGWMYGENGRTGKSELVLDAVQVPLIVWGPDVVPARRREIVSLVDVSATVLRLGNVGRAGLEGQSFLPLLRDDSSERWVGTLEVIGQ